MIKMNQITLHSLFAFIALLLLTSGCRSVRPNIDNDSFVFIEIKERLRRETVRDPDEPSIETDGYYGRPETYHHDRQRRLLRVANDPPRGDFFAIVGEYRGPNPKHHNLFTTVGRIHPITKVPCKIDKIEISTINNDGSVEGKHQLGLFLITPDESSNHSEIFYTTNRFGRVDKYTRMITIQNHGFQNKDIIIWRDPQMRKNE